MEFLKKLRFLNANSLKLLAALFMVFDHVGMLLFPSVYWWRCIGRLSMPLFAFAIAEGCRYTKNKLRHFLMPFILGILCQIVYIVFDPNILYLGILFTFSLSIVCIYALQYFKQNIFDKTAPIADKIISGFLLVFALAFVYFFCETFTVDYGFWGCMMPVFASLFDFHRVPAPDKIKKMDVLPVRVLSLGIALLLLVLTTKTNMRIFAPYALLSLPLLLLYNGNKGRYKMKYFFYIFYPSHLAVLQGIAILLTML